MKHASDEIRVVAREAIRSLPEIDDRFSDCKYHDAAKHSITGNPLVIDAVEKFGCDQHCR